MSVPAPIKTQWCPRCDGEGKWWGVFTNDPSEREQWHECEFCGGEGVIIDEKGEEE